MNRILLILATIVGAVLLALLTTPRAPKAKPIEASGDTVEVEGEAGVAIVKTAAARVADGKIKSQKLLESISHLKEEEWLRGWELTERSGKKVSSEQLKGEPYIASFFFSTCPVVCVKQNDQLRLLQQKFRKLPIKLVSITCDPDNDTPEKLAEYAQRFGASDDRWLFLTGDWDYLRKVSGEVFFHGLHRKKDHIEKFLLMSSEGTLIAEYDWHEPEEIKLLEQDVKELLKQQKSQ